MAEKDVLDYRKHRLVVRNIKGLYKGAAYDPENKLVRDTHGATYDEVKTALEKYVDEVHGGVASSRTSPPEVSEYVRAFQKMLEAKKLPDSYLAMLKAHFHAPNRTMSVKELAVAGGYKSWPAVNLHYGKLGYLLSEEVSMQLPRHPSTGEFAWSFVFATEGEKPTDESEWQWKMRPEVAAAMEQLGWQN